ncbi:MAG: FKBP-type peptidyl-prolyl cis-trans isomerase [Archangium sp.]
MLRLALVTVLLLVACKKDPKPYAPQPPVTLEGGVIIQTLREGDGPGAKKGTKVSMHFTGTLVDGGVFDTSYKRGPMQFWVGEGHVLPGLDQGLFGMKEGELRRITVPPSLGYGIDAKPNIPPNSTLIFEAELM